MSNRKQRWLLLSSSTGTGHNIRAQALTDWTARLYGDQVEVQTLQVLEGSHPLNRFGVELYNWIQRNGPWMHWPYFYFLEWAALERNESSLLGRQAVIERIQAFHPDVVISLHDQTNHGYLDLVRTAVGPLPRAIICGELMGGRGFSRHWINPEADLWIGTTPYACAAARRQGMPEERCFQGGLLLRPGFFEPAPVPSSSPGPVHVTLGTGHAAANNHHALLEGMEAKHLDAEVNVLCGRNAALFDSIQQSASRFRSIRVQPLKYIDDPAPLVRSTDIFVARAGACATSECLFTRTPLVHNGCGGWMPQELPNRDFCARVGAARQAGSTRAIVEAVADLVQRPEERQRIRQAQESITPPSDPREICRRIHELA